MTKEEEEEKRGDMFIYDILLHWAFVVIWGLFIGFIIESLCEFSMRDFYTLSHFHYTFGVLRDYVRVVWDLSLLRSELVYIVGMRDE